MLRQILWKNLSHIDLLHMDPQLPPKMDLIISGGGFLGYYLVGMDRVLKKLQRQRSFIIERYAGTSVGSLAAVAMVCDVGDSMISLYDQIQGDPHYFQRIRQYFLSILPKDAYERCSYRVFISISVLEWTYGFPLLKNMVVSEFENNEDLVDACMASSNVPFFVSSFPFYHFRGKCCLDGCFTRNTPLFPIGDVQLIVRLHRIPYSWKAAFTPFYNMALPLIIKGAVETELFFLQHVKESMDGVLSWYVPGTRKKNLNKFPLRKYLMCLVSLSLCLFSNTLDKTSTYISCIKNEFHSIISSRRWRCDSSIRRQ